MARWTSRAAVLASGLLLSLAYSVPAAAQRGPEVRGREELQFSATGHTFHGDWRADVVASSGVWQPGSGVQLEFVLRFSDQHLANLVAAGIKADKLCLLVTAERTFDADGWMRLASDERMSTILTPTGLSIEGGVQGAVTTRYGYQFKSPLDQLVTIPVAEVKSDQPAGTVKATFAVRAALPDNLPPGLYRLRFDVGVMVGTRVYNFNGYTFASRPFSTEAGTSTYFYSPIIAAGGTHVSGRVMSGRAIQARFPWLLLANYNSNGYKGVVADEDAARFATSDRSLIPDDVILPMYDNNGNRLSYSLEPQFPADTIDPLQNIAWDWTTGQLSVKILGPDGSQVDLGTAPIVAKSGNGPTTKNSAFTAWRPQAYGRYTVIATGWIADQDGRRYEGGGTYRFWIAKRMTLATATFQGMPYPVGSSYGRDIQFNPAVPADVQVTARLFVNSDRANVRTLTYSGRASTAGIFGAAQGMKSFPLDAPGEYHAQVLATYTDSEKHLWVSTMHHAGIVYSEPSPVIARGKKIAIGGKYLERGETKVEGWIDPNGDQHLQHITFPYYSGDVLLIAAEGQGANKIEPVLTYQMQGDTSPWDTTLNGVGTTNLRIKTSNGYSPHLYPEFITDLEYYYAAAPRPGFMGRFIVADSITRAPYWPVSPNSFGSQIGASPNGDAPGDIYRLLGGVVLRRVGQTPMYSGYIASAFLLPKGTNNNRIVAAGSEDLHGPLGDKARFFLVGLRPGTAYEVGSTFRPAVQIDPLLPVSITFVLTYPDGRQQTASGTGDRFGSFAGPTAWPLDVPGIYKYRLRATWNGFEGRMPGLPDSGGEFFVYSKTRPAGVAGLKLDGATTRTFSASGTLTITGTSGAASVRYALITPGAVIEQGDLPVANGRFSYRFDPVAVHAKVPLYDVVSITTGQPQIGRVIHLTFFSAEPAAGGVFHDFARVILRGTTALSARAVIPAAALAVDALLPAAPGWNSAASQGGSPVFSATDPVSIRAWDARIDRMIRDGDLRLVRVDEDTVLPGRSHERLQQYYDGVPVAGADVARQIEAGATVSVFGTLRSDIDVGVTPEVTAAQARQAIERAGGGRLEPDVSPALVVLPLEDGRYALAWHGEARSGTDVRSVYVDATTGRVLADHSNLKGQQAAGGAPPQPVTRTGVSARQASSEQVGAAVVAYDLRGDIERAAAVVGGGARLGARDAAADPTDGAVASTVASLEETAGFYRRIFGRAGLDGRGAAATAIVHAVRSDDWVRLGSRYPLYFAGGFWDGHLIVVGEGLPAGATLGGRTWVSSSSALDLMAHEYTHGVLDHSSRLLYRGEAGALSEAFADIMGTAVEFASQPPGEGREHADYVMGEDAASGGVRSLAAPAAQGGADHYSQIEKTAWDNGGVHANSTVASHAYYLAVEGGANATSGLAVAGVGNAKREQIERAFYRAFVYMLPSSAGFATARAATIQSARDLYGGDSAAARAITAAWTAVGVK